jgi:ABC-type uncharacterized transport system ATPase subunit
VLQGSEQACALLRVDAVTREFGGVRALDGVSLSVAPGELVCVIGPNGCGKTTLFNVITAQLRPTRGSVVFDGRPLVGLRPDRIARLGVARKFQVPSVFEDLTVAENVGVARFGTPAAVLPELDEVLGDVQLSAHAAALAGSLSHGARQWLEIGMLLAQAPRLMLLDEPTAGMTGPETIATVDLIRRLRARSGAACVVVEHDMRFVEALGARVVVMLAGRVVADGSFAEVRQLPEVRDAYLGTHG